MWKLMAADWHIWVAESRRRIWQPSRSGNPRREACRAHITHLPRQHKETASNRESAALQSQRQRESLTLRQEDRRRGGRDGSVRRERGGDPARLSWSYWRSIDFGTSASPFVNYTALNELARSAAETRGEWTAELCVLTPTLSPPVRPACWSTSQPLCASPW